MRVWNSYSNIAWHSKTNQWKTKILDNRILFWRAKITKVPKGRAVQYIIFGLAPSSPELNTIILSPILFCFLIQKGFNGVDTPPPSISTKIYPQLILKYIICKKWLPTWWPRYRWSAHRGSAYRGSVNWGSVHWLPAHCTKPVTWLHRFGGARSRKLGHDPYWQ